MLLSLQKHLLTTEGNLCPRYDHSCSLGPHIGKNILSLKIRLQHGIEHLNLGVCGPALLTMVPAASDSATQPGLT